MWWVVVLKATLVFILGPNLQTRTLLRPRPKLNISIFLLKLSHVLLTCNLCSLLSIADVVMVMLQGLSGGGKCGNGVTNETTALIKRCIREMKPTNEVIVRIKHCIKHEATPHIFCHSIVTHIRIILIPIFTKIAGPIRHCESEKM